jgi:hypothetical protein
MIGRNPHGPSPFERRAAHGHLRVTEKAESDGIKHAATSRSTHPYRPHSPSPSPRVNSASSARLIAACRVGDAIFAPIRSVT